MLATPSTRARRAPTLRGLAAAVLLAIAAPDGAGEPPRWQRIEADSRAVHLATLAPAEKRAFARDDGFENLLPKTDGGATIPVTNCNDSGPGSLRDAIASAASGDTVDATVLQCSTISLTTGDLEVTGGNLTVIGPGPDALTIEANQSSRVFFHQSYDVIAPYLTLYGMTIRDGYVVGGLHLPPAQGGCIWSNGVVRLGNPLDPSNRGQGVVVTGCTATGPDGAVGGGVFAMQGLFLSASVISGNQALSDYVAAVAGGGVALRATDYGNPNAGFISKYSEIRDNSTNGKGGGVFVDARSAELVASTIAGNHAGTKAGGGTGGASLHLSSDGDVLIENTTISGNNAIYGDGGLGVFGAGTVLIGNSTIAGNSTEVGSIGGADLGGSSVELESSIFSGNDASGAPQDVATNTNQISGANNLIGAYSGLIPTTDLIVSSNPGLAALANNGGLTRTHALLAGSPAINAGNNSQNIQVDQRGNGYPRVIGAATDIGAFEFDPGVVFQNGFD